MDLLNLLLHIGGLILYIICMIPFKQTLMDSRETISGRAIGFVLLLIYPITLTIIYLIECRIRAKNR